MRRVIVACDGIWTEPDQELEGRRPPSSVVKMSRAIRLVASGGIDQIRVGTGRSTDK